MYSSTFSLINGLVYCSPVEDMWVINSTFVIDGTSAEEVDDLSLLLWLGGGLVGDDIAELEEDSSLLR